MTRKLRPRCPRCGYRVTDIKKHLARHEQILKDKLEFMQRIDRRYKAKLIKEVSS